MHVLHWRKEITKTVNTYITISRVETLRVKTDWTLQIDSGEMSEERRQERKWKENWKGGTCFID